MSPKTDQTKKTQTSSKQIAAIIGIVLLVFLYAVTLVLAFVDRSAGMRFFMLSLFGTFVIPVVVFLYCWMCARLTGRKNIGDPEDPV